MKKIIKAGRVALGTLFLITAVTVIVLIGLPSKAVKIDTWHDSWRLVRETASEDGRDFATVYDLTGASTPAGDFASKDSSTLANGGPYRIKSTVTGVATDEWNSGKWMFAISGENFNDVDDTFSFNLVGWSKTNGMLQNILEGNGVLGTQAVIIYPDGGDALGATISETGVTYTHATLTFTVTNRGFDGAVVGMMARVTGSGFTDEIVNITAVTDVNIIVCDVTTSTTNATDATVQINPAVWADTITLDEVTKWPLDMGGDGNNIQVYNSGDNEVAVIVVDLTDIEWIQWIIYDADGATGEEAGNITVYGRIFLGL